MEIKIDINDSIQKAIGVTTKFAEFWKGITFPGNLGPALSYLIILGLLPFVGFLLSGIIPKSYFGFWYAPGIMYGLVSAIVGYIVYLALPLVMGAILAALDGALKIEKGDMNAYATALAYAATPSAIGSLFAFVPWLDMIIGIVFFILSLVVTFLAFTEGMGIESGQAILLMIIMAVVIILIWAIIFMLIINSIFGVGMGGMMYRPY